jgi:hypothetical protein
MITANIESQPTEEERTAATTILGMIWGIHVSRAVYAVAELGIPDLLEAGPMSSESLARATGTHEPSLYRVLRLLAALGVFREDQARSFSLTILGDRLRSDSPASMRAWALLHEALGGVRAFEYTLETVRTGEPGLKLAHSMPTFEFLARDPDRAAAFDAAMSERTAAFAPSVAATYDFSDMRTVVDLGGGQGTLLAAILHRHPHLQGVLFETPTVAGRATAALSRTDLADRCEVVAGDFFGRIPERADAYVMANVLHDWDDSRAIDLLDNCRRAMAKHSKVLIVERLIPDDLTQAVPVLLSDLNMLVFTGGQERTNGEYDKLLEAAGLTMGRVQPVAPPYGVIEGLLS